MMVLSSPSSSFAASSRGWFLLIFRLLCWFCATTSTTTYHHLDHGEGETPRTSLVPSSRLFFVSANNSPAGSGTGLPNTGNSNSTSSWTLRSDRPASEVVRDIVIIFFAGVAIIGSLVCATYVVTVLFDRFRGWFGIPPPDDDGVGGRRGAVGPVFSQPVHVGRLVHEAGLHGISKEQRMLLVQCILPPTPYDGKGFKTLPLASLSTAPTNSREDNDVERAEEGDVDSGAIQTVQSDRVGADEGHVPGSPVHHDADDIDYEHTCSICLTPYEMGEDLLRSQKCAHVFHWECCQEWLQKRDVCPYCRTPMFTADELRVAAIEVFGPSSLEQLGRASHPLLVTTADVAADPSTGGEASTPPEVVPEGQEENRSAETLQRRPSSGPQERRSPGDVESSAV